MAMSQMISCEVHIVFNVEPSHHSTTTMKEHWLTHIALRTIAMLWYTKHRPCTFWFLYNVLHFLSLSLPE